MLICSGCTNPSSDSGRKLVNKTQLTPQEKGIYDAELDVNNGKFEIHYFGKPWSMGKPLIDDKTGLPIKIVDGCAVTQDFIDYNNAYNETVIKAAKTLKILPNKKDASEPATPAR